MLPRHHRATDYNIRIIDLPNLLYGLLTPLDLWIIERTGAIKIRLRTRNTPLMQVDNTGSRVRADKTVAKVRAISGPVEVRASDVAETIRRVRPRGEQFLSREAAALRSQL